MIVSVLPGNVAYDNPELLSWGKEYYMAFDTVMRIISKAFVEKPSLSINKF
jgi:hypothetical protein